MLEKLKNYDTNLRREILKEIISNGFENPSLENLLDEVKTKIIEKCLKEQNPDKKINLNDVLEFKKKNAEQLRKEWKLSTSTISRDLGELNYYKIRLYYLNNIYIHLKNDN